MSPLLAGSQMAREVSHMRDQVASLVREKHNLVDQLRRVTSIVDRSKLASSSEEAAASGIAEEIARLNARISDVSSDPRLARVLWLTNFCVCCLCYWSMPCSRV